MQIAPSFCALFNNPLRVGALPSVWKLANVVPVHKHGEKTYVENYRPISLLSLVSKVLERCIFNNIKYHVYEQINPCQDGSMPEKSCITQLTEVAEQKGRELDRGKHIDVQWRTLYEILGGGARFLKFKSQKWHLQHSGNTFCKN